jgi:probable rRNA maturation factor
VSPFFSAKIRASLVFISRTPYKSVIFAKKRTIIRFDNIPDFISSQEVSSLLHSYVESYAYEIDRIVYNFVSKERLLELNKEYLNHDTHTDIITFDYSQNKSLSAEIFISLWAVAHSAESESQTIENETIRVIVHGILHCMGLKDSSEAEKNEMRKREDEFIQLFHVKHKSHV